MPPTYPNNLDIKSLSKIKTFHLPNFFFNVIGSTPIILFGLIRNVAQISPELLKLMTCSVLLFCY